MIPCYCIKENKEDGFKIGDECYYHIGWHNHRYVYHNMAKYADGMYTEKEFNEYFKEGFLK